MYAAAATTHAARIVSNVPTGQNQLSQDRAVVSSEPKSTDASGDAGSRDKIAPPTHAISLISNAIMSLTSKYPSCPESKTDNKGYHLYRSHHTRDRV